MHSIVISLGLKMLQGGLDYQPLFGKGVRDPPQSFLARNVGAAEIEPGYKAVRGNTSVNCLIFFPRTKKKKQKIKTLHAFSFLQPVEVEVA